MAELALKHHCLLYWRMLIPNKVCNLVENGHQNNTCYDEIRLCAQIIYSNLLLKYASRFSAQIFGQKIGFIFYCLNMSCIVICHKCMNFYS